MRTMGKAANVSHSPRILAEELVHAGRRHETKYIMNVYAKMLDNRNKGVYYTQC